MVMNWLDIVLIVILAVSAFSGFANGLIKAVFSLVGLILALFLAGRTYVALADQLTFISNENVARIVAFAVIFLAVIIIAAILGKILTGLVSAILLGWLNRLGGAAFGLILGAIFLSAVLAIWVKYIGAGSAIINSAMASFLLDGFPIILGLLPEEFNSVQEFFHQ